MTAAPPQSSTSSPGSRSSVGATCATIPSRTRTSARRPPSSSASRSSRTLNRLSSTSPAAFSQTEEDMSQAHDWSWLEEGLVEPEITLDMYLTLPEHLSRKVEVEDGRVIVCESLSPSHQRISRNLIQALMDVTEKHDRETRSC